MAEYQDILDFWFGNTQNQMQNSEKWWKKDEAFDQVVKEKFEPYIEESVKGRLEAWKDSPLSCLAYIILHDQFTRNMYRNTPKSFAYDKQALEACLYGLDENFDKKLSLAEKWFFYMPLMHSEIKTIQERSVNKFTELAEEAPPDLKKTFEWTLDYAVRHKEIIDRFGRFPHRNNILGRETTPAETEFLKQPGSSF